MTDYHKLSVPNSLSLFLETDHIDMVRMRSDPRTQLYVARRTAEGKSSKEIHRCLKRYIIRELYPIIMSDLKETALLI